MVGKYLNFRTDKLLRLACIRHRIFSQEETRIHCQRFQRIFRVSKTIEGSTIGSSNFRTNAVLLELRIIISQTNSFILTIVIMVDPVHSISKWSDQHITVLRTSPRTTDMHLSKSIHPFRHRQPSTIGRRRTVGRRLYHAIRTRRSDKYTSQSLGTDTRVDILRQRSHIFSFTFSHHTCPKLRLVNIHQIWLYLNSFSISLFISVLYSRHYQYSIFMAIIHKLFGYIFRTNFHIRRLTYSLPFFDSFYIRCIYLYLHFRSQFDELWNHFCIGKPKETILFESFCTHQLYQISNRSSFFHIKKHISFSLQRIQHSFNTRHFETPKRRTEP